MESFTVTKESCRRDVRHIINELERETIATFGNAAILFIEQMEDTKYGGNDDKEYMVTINLPPTKIGDRVFYNFVWIIHLSECAGDDVVRSTNIIDIANYFRNGSNSHPHIHHGSGTMCHSRGQIIDSLRNKDYLQATIDVMAKIGTYTPEDAYRNAPGIVVCQVDGCANEPDYNCSRCGGGTCYHHSASCALCRHRYCNACDDYEAVNDATDAVCNRCKDKGNFIRCECRPNCAMPMWEKSASKCRECGKILHISHAGACVSHFSIFGGTDTFYTCTDCHNPLMGGCVQCFPEDGKVCASPRCRHAKKPISKAAFSADGRTTDGLCKYCKGCQKVMQVVARADKVFASMGDVLTAWRTANFASIPVEVV